MRSRYTAFTIGSPAALEYLLATHHPDYRTPKLREELRASIAGVGKWEQLEVLSASVEGEHGSVEFVATYRIGGERKQLHELSNFVRADRQWLYTDGTIR